MELATASGDLFFFMGIAAPVIYIWIFVTLVRHTSRLASAAELIARSAERLTSKYGEQPPSSLRDIERELAD